MKTRSIFTTLAISIFTTISIFCQVPESINEKGDYFYSANQVQNNFKAGGDTIWHTTFDWEDPESIRGWTLPDDWEIAEVTDFGYNWIWQKDTFKYLDGTRWFTPPSHFETPEDGFLLMPIQAYNLADGVFVGNDVDAYIMTESIDCSNAPSVVVSLNQYFRHCCGAVYLEMSVTNDDGVHWAVYDMTFGTPNNSIIPPKYRSVEINISDVAAGMNDVRLKFEMRNAENYYWFIDDLILTEAYEVDLALEDYWAEMNGGFDETVGHINYLPMSQIGMESPTGGLIGDYSFIGAVQNVGMEDIYDGYLNIQVKKNGEEIVSVNSEPTDLWTLDRDTLSPAEPFIPDEYGDYLVTYDAVAEGETRPENNINSYSFTVNDTLYLRSDMTQEDGANSGGWGGSNQAGDMVGMKYDITAPTEVNGITSYITGFVPENYPAFQYVLMKSTEEDGYVEWLVSDIVEMDSSLMFSWVTLNLDKDGETEFLEPGEYIACVRMWGDDGDEEGNQGMWIGRDLTTKCVNKYTWVYLVSSQSGFEPNKLLMIGLNLNESGGPTEAPVTFNVDMNKHIQNGEFNPGSDNVDVAGTFNDWAGSGWMTDDDGDGIYSITIPGFGIGEKIEFKYRINANWDTSEFPFGGPNREYKIRYWNDLNHVYNNGETTAVKNISLNFDYQVYPNPNNGRFRLVMKADNYQPARVTIYNSTGKSVYNRIFENCVHIDEEISLNIPAGLYFLKIENDGTGHIEKIIVK